MWRQLVKRIAPAWQINGLLVVALAVLALVASSSSEEADAAFIS